MNRRNRYSKLFVYDPLVFVEKMLHYSWRNYLICRISYTLLNIIIMLSSFSVVSLTAWIFAGIRLGYIEDDGFPAWFLLSSASISAGTALFGSFINFFSIKVNMEKHYQNHAKISSEVVYFKVNDHDHYKLFLNVCLIMGIEEAFDDRINYEKDK